ncbi:hypothetical protein [Aerococcus urinae]|nr:hypothetical protein [Aerococcus urinae]MDK8379260.1 hypothetical protein [Aerococcus urinae]MDK8841010.1 hypothetical protein [Aerococcus urinae]
MVKESRADIDAVEKMFYSDLYNYAEDLTDGEKEVLQEVEKVLKEDIYPVLDEH